MNAQKKSSLLTTPSTSPVVKRVATPYSEVNPESSAQNVVVIEDRVFHAPLHQDFTEIDDVIGEGERDARRSATLARARQRLAKQLETQPLRATLAYLRLKAGMSQSKVAESLGNSQSSYSLIESGRREIMFATFEKLVEILQVSRDELANAIKNSREKTL